MRGKGINSVYLITSIFSTDYFHYYSNPALFFAYFFPFIAYGKSEPYLDDEFNEKLNNIKSNKHGNYYNYATQGFGNIAFFKPNVSFSYFYNQLCKYDKDKSHYFNIQPDVGGIESKQMREDLSIVLSKEKLFLKRNYLVLESIKSELLQNLVNHENKYVLAKLLYYIVCEQHILPNTTIDIHNNILKELNIPTVSINNLNVSLGFRKEKDINLSDLYYSLKEAKSLQILCLNGISIFGDKTVSKSEEYTFEKFKNMLLEIKNMSVEVVLSAPKCITTVDACNYQMNYNSLAIPKVELSEVSLKKIIELKRALPNERIMVKITNKAIPYALFIVKFENERMNYIKVDLYSPFVEDNKERPCMYILKASTPKLFEHFSNVFTKIWKNDMYSSFI